MSHIFDAESRPAMVWPASGQHLLQADAQGWHAPTEDYWRLWLQRPELAPVEESCAAERRLHEALMAAPLRPVSSSELQVMADPDIAQSYGHFLRLREALIHAGTLEQAYLGWVRDRRFDLPPLFMDLVVQAVVARMLAQEDDALVWRAAELLFRPQRVAIQEGRVLSGDLQVLDDLHRTGGLGELGRLLMEGGVSLPGTGLQVLGDDNAGTYLADRCQDGRHRHLLDLTHGLQQTLSHGLVLNLNNARSGLRALAQVLERWVKHFLGVKVTIRPEARVDDPAWRWHLGLDVQSSALLDALYQGQPVPEESMRRLISLFRMEVEDPAVVQADMQGRPVYLGLAMDAEGRLRLKPQNLLLNLPLKERR
ncbi:DUF6352 family protein [Hydrogenophaga sp.]|uniref:DUF6352 family protein n=1 Tax=Hydrogenophaga sp. TaxID=1904254 RepID=UPI0035AF82D4